MVSVVDRLKDHALALVLGVVVVLILRAQAPCTKAPADGLLEPVALGLFGVRVLLISAKQHVAGIGQLAGFLAVTGHEIGADGVVARLVDHAQHGQVRLVDLEPGLVLELLTQGAIPLRAGQAVELPILQALLALGLNYAPNVAELGERFGQDVSEFSGLAHGVIRRGGWRSRSGRCHQRRRQRKTTLGPSRAALAAMDH